MQDLIRSGAVRRRARWNTAELVRAECSKQTSKKHSSLPWRYPIERRREITKKPQTRRGVAMAVEPNGAGVP
jgi:hypothetical protein